MSTEDRRRVRSIHHYDVLRRPPRAELVSIVELAAKVCGTPMATVNLITDSEQHQVAAYGFDAAICSREDSMCAAVLEEDTPLVVADARLDPRFRDNPFVTGVIGKVRFYASHQLRTPAGVVIGTLCVFDVEPRVLDPAQVGALSALAERVVDVLELTVRTQELAASNERLLAFARRLSHDLMTPLTGVTMSLGLLQETLGEVEPDTQFLIDRAVGSSVRMGELIADVLSYATVGGALAAAPVALDTVLDEVLADLAGVLEGVQVTRAPLPVVQGDAVQLRSVLQNILDNASKYRHPAWPLTITVDAVVLDGLCRLEIADNGRGIPADQRERVFSPQVRLDDDDRGSGIGLDTVRRVVRAHGGEVGITETPHGGTTVWVELPC